MTYHGDHDRLPDEPQHHGSEGDTAARPHLTPYDQAKQDAEALKAWSFKMALAGHFGFPWQEVYNLTGTLLSGFFVLVGARAKSGKSTFLRECFNAWVTDFKKRVMFVGTEQQAAILRGLWACLRLDISIAALLDPDHPDHMAVVHDADIVQPTIEGAHIYSVPDLTLPRFVDAITYASTEGYDVVMLDHFSRLRITKDPVRDRAEASYVIKNMAVKKDILVVGAAQLKDDGEGGPLGHYSTPSSGSWAGTADLRRECDKAVQLWRPLKPGLTAKQKQAAREHPGALEGIIERNIMAVRCDADRYAVTDKGGMAAKLEVRPTGRLESITTKKREDPEPQRLPYTDT